MAVEVGPRCLGCMCRPSKLSEIGLFISTVQFSLLKAEQNNEGR